MSDVELQMGLLVQAIEMQVALLSTETDERIQGLHKMTIQHLTRNLLRLAEEA